MAALGRTLALSFRLQPTLRQQTGDIPEALIAMSHSAKLYLATSKRETFTRSILENKKLDRLFAGIYGSTPAGNIDHKPELIGHIMRENNLDLERCVMVGDRRYDIAGAHANGILWGYGSQEELEGAGADLLIETPKDLTTAAGESFRKL